VAASRAVIHVGGTEKSVKPTCPCHCCTILRVHQGSGRLSHFMKKSTHMTQSQGNISTTFATIKCRDQRALGRPHPRSSPAFGERRRQQISMRRKTRQRGLSWPQATACPSCPGRKHRISVSIPLRRSGARSLEGRWQDHPRHFLLPALRLCLRQTRTLCRSERAYHTLSAEQDGWRDRRRAVLRRR
jgi:hypothetical protein